MNERILTSCLSSLILLSACGGTSEPDDAGGFDATIGDDAGQDSGSVVLCASDTECSDSLYCTGQERCMPGTAGAGSDGCVAGDTPCMMGETCSEEDDRCTPNDCVDEDGDGFDTCSGDCDDGNANINPSTEEQCIPDNPTDEDCNPRTYGFVDIDMDGAADARCFNEESDGTRHGGTDCDDNNASISPTGAEVCDGRFDENCDGTVDEGCLCSPEGSTRGCGPGLGECAGAVETCTASGWTTCSATPGTEVCDGTRDEDCDGSVDEGCSCLAGSTQACGRGACGGQQRCVGGTWDACDGAAPTTETCDGVDTDCDGISDSDDPDVAGAGELCGSDTGACVAGTMTCLGSTLSCVGETTARPEVCDGSTDENCNGTTDEGCDCVNGTTQSCGRGACRGTQRCVSGAWNACDGSAPSTERCDGVDSDCDGVGDASDPDVVGVGLSCGSNVGACVAGTMTCVGSSLSCSGEVGPEMEVCDGPAVDEDCDGTGNEDCGCTSGTMQACQTGDCAGNQLCTAGAWGACLGAGGAPAPVPGTLPEMCDGRDNNCNGLDDTSDPAVMGVGDSCGTGVGDCVAGTQVCVGSSLSCGGSYVAPGTETCNHSDDNCDGNADDGVSIAAECGLTIGPGSTPDFNYNCYPGEASCNGANLAGGALTNQIPRSAFARWNGDFGRRAYFRMRAYLTRTSSGPSAGWVSMIITPTRSTSADTSSVLIADGLPTLAPTDPAIAVSLNGAGNAFYVLHNTSTGWQVVNGPHAMPSGCTSVPTARTPYTFEFNNDGDQFVARVAQVSCATRVPFTDASLWDNLYGSGASYPTFFLGLAADNDGGLDADLRDLHVERWIRGSDRNNCMGCD